MRAADDGGERWTDSVLRQIGLTVRRAREAIVHIATASNRVLDPDEAIVFLGRAYAPRDAPARDAPPPADSAAAALGTEGETALDTLAPSAAAPSPKPLPGLSSLLADCGARVWLSYRTGMEPFGIEPEGGLRSDVGWGCMVRSGQMLLANALVLLALGRDWRPAGGVGGGDASGGSGAGEGAGAAEGAGAGEGEGEGAGAGAGTGDRPRDGGHAHAPILALFADAWAAPFSLQRLTAEGERAVGLQVGSWYGPAAICVALARALATARAAAAAHAAAAAPAATPALLDGTRAEVRSGAAAEEATAVAAAAPAASAGEPSASPAAAGERAAALDAALVAVAARVPILSTLVIHVAMDGFVSTAQLEEACAHPDGWRPLLLLLPLRLGLDRFHAPYAAALAQLLALRACVGMVGGRPRRSFYFAGVQGAPDATTPPPPPPRAPPPKPPAALYWDPHTAQPALGTDGERGGAPRWPLSAADLASCHCAGLRQMRLADLDPSLALGFLCATKAELREWAAAAAAICASAEPLFAVQAHPLARAATRRPAEGAEVEGADDGGGRAAHDQAAPADGGGGYDDDEDDDLVIV